MWYSYSYQENIAAAAAISDQMHTHGSLILVLVQQASACSVVPSSVPLSSFLCSSPSGWSSPDQSSCLHPSSSPSHTHNSQYAVERLKSLVTCIPRGLVSSPDPTLSRGARGLGTRLHVGSHISCSSFWGSIKSLSSYVVCM